MGESDINLFIDVDTGIDDALAILYAAATPRVRLVGVSTVCGNVDLVKATRNTLAVLALAGRAETPVHVGAAGPLLIASESASDVHGGSGLGRAVLPEPVALPSRTPAAAAIVAAAKAHPGGVDLVATGPLTNIAAAMILEPDLPRLLKSFTLMGGAFTIAGNVTPAAEFNIWHDPEAARYVVRHFAREDVPLPVAVGLDATHQARLSEAEVEALAARMDVAPNGKALANFLRDCTAHYFDFMQERIGRRVLTLHDPLAVAAAIDPSLLTCSPFAVDVETEGKFARGLTLADRRERATPARATLAVALGVDAERFRHDFTSALERLAC